MIQMESLAQVADNAGARSAKMIGFIGKRTRQAHIGDIITCHIRESIPTASVKKGTVVKAVVVRTAEMCIRDSLMTAAEVNIEQLMNADAVILVDNALETLASRPA